MSVIFLRMDKIFLTFYMWVILECIFDIVNVTLLRLFLLSLSEVYWLFFSIVSRYLSWLDSDCKLCHPCGDDNGTGLISGCLSFALYVCGLGVSHRLVQYLHKTVACLPLSSAGFLPHCLISFVAFFLKIFSSARKMMNFSVGFLTSTRCGHDEWRLIS